MSPDETSNENESVTIVDQPGEDGSLPLPEPEEPQQPEIDQAFTVIVNGKQWILGLGLDSNIYNWDFRTGYWTLFVLETPSAEDVI